MYERPPVVALRDYLAGVVAAHPSLAEESHREELHRGVCDVVDELKGADWPPERIIIAVKQIADDAGMHPTRSILSATSPLTQQDLAIVSMVRWCIERYYGATFPPK